MALALLVMVKLANVAVPLVPEELVDALDQPQTLHQVSRSRDSLAKICAWLLGTMGTTYGVSPRSAGTAIAAGATGEERAGVSHADGSK